MIGQDGSYIVAVFFGNFRFCNILKQFFLLIFCCIHQIHNNCVNALDKDQGRCSPGLSLFFALVSEGSLI